ncbi:MAG: ADP-ribosylglycohydrolase family protein [Clostridia bacterium]|nr:ADP-ribosylglycohydrolase family protein [Clostridia bacterium]
MPGYADYKKLYAEEYMTLFEEGYDVEKYIIDDENDENFCPNPKNQDKYPEGDDFWKRPYENLVKIMDTPLRVGYPYVEPNDFDEIMAQAGKAPSLEPLTDEEYKNRIYGAFYGRCAAVILGKPLEMGLSKKFIREYLESVDAYPLNDFVPAKSEKLNFTLREDCIYSAKGHVEFAQSDDDIHYTLLGLSLVENKGLDFTKSDIGNHWCDNFSYHWCWCASRVAYHHVVGGTLPLDKIPYTINPWRECIDGQIRTDIWGYIFPSQIEKACKYAHKDTSFSLTKNGIYGGMFVAGALAGALSKKPTVDTIIDAGLASIPQKSRLYEAISLVRAWYKETPNWDIVADKILDKYGYLPGEATINNMAMVALGIIAGELDYTKSITIATMCGIDTDCNAGTVGSIVGAAVGIDNIEKRWYEPLNDKIKTALANFGECSISNICERIIRQKNRFEAK